MENTPDHGRTVRNGSIAMIALGVLLFVLSLVYLIPHDMGVTSDLRSRGVHTPAVVTECTEVSGPRDNPAGNADCRVRFTTPGGTSVETRLAYVTDTIKARDTVTVVYDPRHTDVAALASSIGFWNSLGRNVLDVVALVASVVMTLLGLAVHLAYRRLTRARRRPRRGSEPATS
ncbi:hypothetical protein GCM10018790_19460 [Kitasatospora xanthocidica]|uniref:DUF3592 domain-containing protein n=1 Tax=Kitasatospora xanthocidica TaxID=83382 RepID=UPI0016751ED4|nr:DUF3592 domain-containing protein [Kitasatospora xanthocidica]GHF41865.1 hypothetical protein GCM10018790_19460 [Kitasatospora xanthocidica]